MNIRKYNESDFYALTTLWQEVFPNDPAHNAPDKVIHDKLKVDDLVFVVEQDKSIIGACIAGYDGHRGWLYAVAIAEHARRSGIGKQLIKTALDELKQLGCHKVNLQIRPTNHGVARFYESLGFTIEDRLSMGAFI